ncbi:DEAD/DEAH box helicase [Clostridium chromiireducens]|uniref:DEAD/DEAH box helicase n=1 Tax=Clostridium chromiireducens TaxID=225345 RepID=UPI003AF8A933
MKKIEYLELIKDRLKKISINEKLLSFKSQMYAFYIGADITKKFSESYLWNNAMFLATNSSILLEEDITDYLALNCLKISAEIYELFANISESYDREYSNVLAALCYDLAGYQANAICLLRKSGQYSVESYDDKIDDHSIKLDNYILMHVQNILLKRIPKAYDNIYYHDSESDYEIFNRAIKCFYDNILYGKKTDYEKSMKEASGHFHKMGNVYISQILHLMNVRIKLYTERSIRSNLSEYIDLENDTWKRYVKLLAFDFYSTYAVKNIDERISIFELWQSQIKALKSGILQKENNSYVIQMPTSAGKTFIAELIILKKLIEQPNKKIIYIAPYRALRNEKEQELGKNLSKLGYIVSTVSGSYEVDELHESIVDKTDVIIATPEKIDLMLRLDKNLFKDISLLVVDEGHMIGNLSKLSLPKLIKIDVFTEDVVKKMTEEEKNIFKKYYHLSKKNKKNFYLWNENRSSNEENILYKFFVRIGIIEYEIDERSNLLEFLIVRLLYINEYLQTLFLSAVMPRANSEDLSRWLSGVGNRVIDGNDECGYMWEPTRKLFGNLIFNSKNKTMSIKYPNVKIGNDVAFVPNFVFEEEIKFRNEKTGRINTVKFPNYKSKADVCAAVAIKIINNKLGNCLIFAAQPQYVLAIAGAFSEYFKLMEVSNSENELVKFHKNESNESYYHAKRLYGENSDIAICLKYGIGIHYGKMYEAVRKSVEEDFRRNKLKCLIATNTIGQGLNFPIKNIIIHSIDINPVINKSLSVRDFWNVVGRAGRAGKETEGQILFVTLSSRDQKISDFYNNIENIESVESSYLNVIADMAKNRISNDTFIDQTSNLIEPFLLDLLSEEYLTDNNIIIEKICNKSLVNIQIDNDEEMKDIFYQGLYNNLLKIRNEVKDLDTIKRYSKTGFHIKGNKIIENFINSNYLLIERSLMNDDYKILLELYMQLLYCNEIQELIIDKDCDITVIDNDEFKSIIFDWVSGRSFKELKEDWERITSGKCNLKFEEFVETGLLYRYPWGMTALLEHIFSVFKGINLRHIPNVINLATFIKCGLNDILACYLYSLGMKNRLAVNDICGIFRKKVSRHGCDDFIKWLINMNSSEIEELNLNIYDHKDLRRIIVNISQRNMYSHVWYTENEIKFNIRDINTTEDSRRISKNIKVGDKITYYRDYENSYNPYSIRFYYNDQMIGTLPSEFSMYIATEIDLNNSEYIVNINEIEECNEYNNINIIMKLKK